MLSDHCGQVGTVKQQQQRQHLQVARRDISWGGIPLFLENNPDTSSLLSKSAVIQTFAGSLLHLLPLQTQASCPGAVHRRLRRRQWSRLRKEASGACVLWPRCESSWSCRTLSKHPPSWSSEAPSLATDSDNCALCALFHGVLRALQKALVHLQQSRSVDILVLVIDDGGWRWTLFRVSDELSDHGAVTNSEKHSHWPHVWHQALMLVDL